MLNGIIKLFYSEVVKVNMKKMPSSEYKIRDEYKNINNFILKIDRFLFSILKVVSIFFISFFAFSISMKFGAIVSLVFISYILYKKILEYRLKICIKTVKNSIETINEGVLTNKEKTLINILISFFIIGFISEFNFVIVMCSILVFLFTIKGICSNIK